MKLTFGSDPEIMLREVQTGSIVSAIAVLKQGKDDKIDLGNGVKVYYDNVLAETNINPSDSRDGAVANFRDTLSRIAGYLGDKYDIVPQASHTFTEEQCNHDDARVFGCNPEYDAYELEMCMPPECTNTFRSAGGHIHVGRSDFNEISDIEGQFLLDPFSKVNTVKLMDIFIGLPIALIDNDPTSPARKAIYGNAGRHRPTAYGVEYRTPSNYWIGSPDLVGLVHDLTMHSLALIKDNKADEIIGSLDSASIVKAVNTNDKQLAASLLEKSGLPDNLMKAVFERADRRYKSLYEEWQLR